MKFKFLSIVAVALFVSNCQKNDPQIGDLSKTKKVSSRQNARIASPNGRIDVLMAEYITAGESDEVGNIVYFNNRGNKQLSADFVPGDPRRGGRTNIEYIIDDQVTTDNGLSATDVTGAITNSMNTWEGVNCSNIGITKLPFAGDAGYISAVFGFGGTPNFEVDLQHCGFLPGAFFNILAPGGSNFILGVTFTFIWVDGDNNPTDIDNNGKGDVAFREIYYNDNFSWNTDGRRFDIETVSLHEAGHGLSQGHFGKAFRTEAGGKLHFSPRAVMNAAYSGVQRSINQTDEAGHCSNWARWPNR